MGKIPLILVTVIVIWVAVTVYREGPDRAFGGLFSLLALPQYGQEAPPTRSERLADHVDKPPPARDDSKPWWTR
jgi:hypothetical protein